MKVILATVLIGMLLFGMSANDVEAATDRIYQENTVTVSRIMGDADGDGAVTARDARAILRESVRLERLEYIDKLFCDFDENGIISAADARRSLRISVHIEPPYERTFTVSQTDAEDKTEDTSCSHVFSDYICNSCGYSQRTACYDALVNYVLTNGSAVRGVYSVTDNRNQDYYSLNYDENSKELYVYTLKNRLSNNDDILQIAGVFRIFRDFSAYEEDISIFVNSQKRCSAVFSVDALAVSEDSKSFLTLINTDASSKGELSDITEKAEDSVTSGKTKVVGSTAFVPPAAGLIIASEVVKDLL